jgi:hypothetical protein
MVLLALGALGVVGGTGAAVFYRYRQRRLAAEARELVDGMWSGRAGAPEPDP